MYKYILNGRVLPERCNVCIPPLNLKLKCPDAGLDCNMVVSIQMSQIYLQITSEQEITDFNTLRNYVADAVHFFIDCYGFITGRGYDIEITSLAGENIQPHMVFGVGIDVLENDIEDRQTQNIEQIIKLFSEDDSYSNQLRLTLKDLRFAIKYPEDSGFFCYRAIESLMQYFNRSNNKDEAWNILREKIHISRNILDYIKKFADDPRHGCSILISDAERAKVMKYTWKIVDRFIYYLNDKSFVFSEELIIS